MKKIWMFVLGLAIFASSCEEKDNMDPIGNWEISPATPLLPTADAVLTLDEATPDEMVNFEWSPATTTNRFGVAYNFLLVPEGSTDYTDPILRLTPANAGRAQSISVSAEEIDYALWAACYPAGSTVDLEWVVQAKAIERVSTISRKISITRFQTDYAPETLYIYGAGTEAGADAANATPMRSIPNAEGEPSGVFDVYTTLIAGETYLFRDKASTFSRVYGSAGADGALQPCGDLMTAPETGQYRVTVDLNNNTFELLKIDRWSLVGDAVEGGWGGDVPLAYVGDGVWEGEIPFLSESGFVFRANGDWSYLLKRVQGSAAGDNKGGELIMESEGNERGVLFEDIPGTIGIHRVTLDLSGDPRTYTLVEIQDQGPVSAVIGETANPNSDAVNGNFNIADMETPDAVYLLSGGSVVAELSRNGDVFETDDYIALEASKTYTLNTASDGSGDDVAGTAMGVARDQAYRITVDFSTGKLLWRYYNIKLFHWDEVGGGWDARQELLMTYIHPYKFEVTGNLSAGFHSKFISPWDVQFGTSATALTGTMENGGDNFAGIIQNGTYKATIVISPDYETAEYSFVKQ